MKGSRAFVMGIAALASIACQQSKTNQAASIKPTAESNSSEQSMPAIALEGRVTDAARILAPTQITDLTQKLEQLERTTQHQMVIVTVPSLGGQDVADFTRNLGNHWGIGRADEDDGVVFLIAPKERKVRIAVGYGLEKSLTNEACQSVLDRVVLPRFRSGDYSGGVIAGTDELIALLRMAQSMPKSPPTPPKGTQ